MKKGFTLIEIMLVVGIISLCSVMFVNSSNNVSLERSITEKKIINTFETMAAKSCDQGKRYKFRIDYDEKNIQIYDGEDLKEKINLSSKLAYEGTYKNSIREFETTETGNFTGGGYTIYILSKEKDKIYSKITIFTGAASLKYVFINMYHTNDLINISNYREMSSDKWENFY